MADRPQPSASVHRRTDVIELVTELDPAGVDRHATPRIDGGQRTLRVERRPHSSSRRRERRDFVRGTATAMRRDNPVEQFVMFGGEPRSLDVRRQVRDGFGSQTPRRSDLVHPAAVSHGQGSRGCEPDLKPRASGCR